MCHREAQLLALLIIIVIAIVIANSKSIADWSVKHQNGPQGRDRIHDAIVPVVILSWVGHGF